jgi:hypothetical protein
MTVVRERAEVFQAPPEKVVAAVRSTLAGGHASYRYQNTAEENDYFLFHTEVRPNWWPLLLSTELAIRLIPLDSLTKVVVQTRSQSFLFGDVFDCYRGYIRDILGALRSRLGEQV